MRRCRLEPSELLPFPLKMRRNCYNGFLTTILLHCNKAPRSYLAEKGIAGISDLYTFATVKAASLVLSHAVRSAGTLHRYQYHYPITLIRGCVGDPATVRTDLTATSLHDKDLNVVRANPGLRLR